MASIPHPIRKKRMTKSTNTLAAFKAQILNGSGVAESDRFEIYIGRPKCLTGDPDFDQVGLAALYAEQVAFPPLSLFVKQCRIFGPAQQRPITSDMGGDGMTISFLMDRNFDIKSMFDTWMGGIVDPEKHTVSYQDNYVTDIEIRQVDRAENVVYKVKLKDAFPRSMMQMDMNQANAGQFHRLMVSFSYHKWSVVADVNPIS